MVEVPAPVRHPGMLARDPGTGLGPVLRSLRLAGQLPLKALELLLRPAQETGAGDPGAVGEDGEDGQAQVDTGLCPQCGEDVGLGLHDEAEEVPAGAVFGDGHRCRVGRKRTRPPDLEMADLGHIHPAVTGEGEGVGVQTDRLPGILLRLVPRRAHPAPLPLARDRVEEVLVGRIQVPQGLLQDNRRHLGKPGTFPGALGLSDTQPRQLGRRHIRQPRRVCFPAVTQTVVPHHTSTPERSGQRTALGGIRVGPVVVTKLHAPDPMTIDVMDG
ncbi:hypothetical protein GCM10027091_61380 [Streptomyces daliensis]